MKTHNLNDLREQALSLINRDIGRMVDSGVPVYRGKTSVPMSALTQRKRALEEQFNNSPAPYSVEASGVLSRMPQGFNEGQKNSLLDILTSGQRRVGDTGWKMIGKQFGDRTGSRQTGFYNKFDKNLNKGLDLSRVGIDALSNDASSLDSEFNSGFGNSLNALGNAEKAKRAGLTNMLGQFGNQQHIYSHLANSADKNKFYEELNAPKQKMKALYNIVNSGGNPDNMGPYGEAAGIKVLEKGLNLYNSPTPRYSGEQLANVPEELATSHRLLGDLSHDYNDSSRGERDNLYSSLMGRENVGSRAIGDLPTIYDPQTDKLDQETKRLLKAEKARISMDHERKGTYGSQSHLSQTEDAINRIAKSRFGNRNNLLQDVLRGRMSSLNKSDMNDLNRLNSLGQQGLSEYQDVLGKISGMNQLGVDKWLNAQDELNQKRERFEEERNQEWPGGSGSDIVKYNVSPEISSIFANPNISSNPSVYTPSLRPNIHALAQYAQTVPVSHSETELESDLNQDMGGIKNYADFENTKIQKKREEERQRVLKSMSEAERVKELNRLYLERLEQYKEAAAKRDNLYNSSNVNGVNAFSWSKSNPSRDFNSFLKHSLGVPDNTPDNVRIISNLNKNLPLYLEEVKRADYYWDQYNKYYQDMMQLKGQMNSEEERQRLFKIAEENRIKQEQEQARIAEAERVRQEQLRAEQARIAEQQRQAQIEQDNILKAKQQALREFAGMQGGRMGTVEELQINNLLRQYFPPTDYRHWVLPAQSSGSSFKEAIARAKWNQMMDNRSKFISLAQQGFPGGILKFLSN